MCHSKNHKNGPIKIIGIIEAFFVNLKIGRCPKMFKTIRYPTDSKILRIPSNVYLSIANYLKKTKWFSWFSLKHPNRFFFFFFIHQIPNHSKKLCIMLTTSLCCIARVSINLRLKSPVRRSIQSFV